MHGVSESGDAYQVIRAREDRIEAGIVKPLQDGVPVDGEVVKLTPRKDMPMLMDVDVQVSVKELGAERSEPTRAPVSTETPARSRKGPARVSSPSYRNNWDSIWKGKRGKSLPN